MSKGRHEISVEELVARFSFEVQRLRQRAAELRALPPLQLAIPPLFQDDQLLKFEQLLKNMLRDARPLTWFERLIAILFKKQLSYNLLGIETLTNLFETYRTVTYDLSDIKLDFVLLQQEHHDQRRKDEARSLEITEALQAQLEQLRNEIAAQRKLLNLNRD
jgi:predicted metal-dependent HD superfamily phosphohydrolase